MTANERKELLMKAKPIRFDTEMVMAILDGRKTVTRRVLKPYNPIRAKRSGYYQGNGLWCDKDITYIKDYSVSCCWIEIETYIKEYAPYKAGDILYVREAFFKEDIKKAEWYMDKLMELENDSDNEIDFTTTSTYFK